MWCIIGLTAVSLTTVLNIRISNILLTYVGHRSMSYNLLKNIRINNCAKY